MDCLLPAHYRYLVDGDTCHVALIEPMTVDVVVGVVDDGGVDDNDDAGHRVRHVNYPYLGRELI